MLALNNTTSQLPTDLMVSGGRYVDSGSDLYTAFVMTLYSDAPAKPGDDVPEGVNTDGWWAQQYLEPGEVYGSRWWILANRNATQDTLILAEQIILEAFDSWIERGWAQSVTVRNLRYVRTQSGDTQLHAETVITAPDGAVHTFAAWQEIT